MAEFLLQGAVFLGFRLRPGVHLRQLFFPVPGSSGSWSHLREAKVDKAEMEAISTKISKELLTPHQVIWMDEVEVILCESKEGRLLKKYDLIVKGQSLFNLDVEGRPLMKFFGTKEWVPVDAFPNG